MAQRNHNFFTVADIALLKKIGGKPYDPTDSNDITLSKQIKADLWGKTLYWHDLVLKQLPGFKGETTTRWLNRGKSFTYYTWTRIYKIGHEGKGIFFTVGVDSQSNCLVYKLDYKNEGSSNMGGYQKEICEDIIKKSPASWAQIDADDLSKYNWNKLVDETVDFIKKYETIYDDVIRKVWYSNEKRLARIAYNEEGWQRPSGKYGKSKSKKSHEGQYGYGNEEWLFDKERLVDGYHYAFLEPIYKYYDLYKGKKFDVTLYTVDADTGKRYWVGEIKNLEVINKKAAQKAWTYYEKKGWLEIMKEDINTIDGKISNFPDQNAVQHFNVRFIPSEGALYDSPIEVPTNNPLYKINRYVLLNNEKQYETVDFAADTFDFTNYNCPLPSENTGIPQKKQYNRPPKVVEMHFLHKKISDKLHRHFAKIYGINKVKTNVRAGYGCNEVDMIIERNDDEIKGLVYYEIKTYDSLRLSIREALGQILEYAMWPDKNRAAKFVIITQPCPGEEAVIKQYLDNLRKNLTINLYYQSFDSDTGFLSDEM